MTYTTLDALRTRFGEVQLIQLTDRAGAGVVDVATVNQELANTDATINAALAVRYQLPLATVPAVVSGIALAIAIYKLHVYACDPKIKDDYDQALKDLDAIATGKRKLDVAGIEPTTNGAGGVMATDRERPITPETMHGYI
ncbi:MAG: gp436 family protein [Sphingomonas pseudosanguinis]|uniref:gp436 family protein n=1 Tax=Sphingomonas pseudosanguinis TaxID=413712 RepID=UPI00391BD72B